MEPLVRLETVDRHAMYGSVSHSEVNAAVGDRDATINRCSHGKRNDGITVLARCMEATIIASKEYDVLND